jgi:hypothetical protein
MTVGSRGMFVGKLAMFESRSCVLLRLFVLAEFVMMGRLMVMMCGSVVVSGRLMVMLTRRMLRCLCHLRYSSLRENNRNIIVYFPRMTSE